MKNFLLKIISGIILTGSCLVLITWNQAANATINENIKAIIDSTDPTNCAQVNWSLYCDPSWDNISCSVKFSDKTCVFPNMIKKE